jgi:glycosyltransferase involved in cell wall biosynthesis
MKVVLTIAGLAPEFGGPSRSVPSLAEALSREGMNVEIIACESETGQSAPLIPDATLVETRLVPARARHGCWRAATNDFFSRLCDSLKTNEPVVIHDNGLWLPTNHGVARAADVLKRPLVISPRGMLSGWAAGHHRWKKRVAWVWFQRRDLFSANVLHATSDQEMSDLRSAGFRGPIAVVPNGIDSPVLARTTQAHRSTHIALCVARLHPIKGLMNLIEAWSEVRPNGWRMLIAGADEDGHLAELKSAITARSLEGVFEFVGAVEGERKWALYRNADLFVLPSYSENFGVGIAEALSNGIPVITTRGTPWKDLIERDCGWWEEVGAAPLAHALREAVTLTDEQRRAIGQRGRELVENKYSWCRVAAEMKSVYAWLLGQGDRPACVTLS